MNDTKSQFYFFYLLQYNNFANMKILCVGRNYALHAKELGNAVPEKPVIFSKPDTAMLLNNEDFYIPDFSHDIHHEVEVIVKINKVGKNIHPDFASNYYQEIGLGIDFTARDLQLELKEKGLPWELAKAFDQSAVIGKWIKKDEIDVNNINFSLIKNDELVQKGNTSEMLFKINDIVSFISRYFTLKTGDIIFSGTPAGVGKVNIGDRLKGYFENELMFDFMVK